MADKYTLAWAEKNWLSILTEQIIAKDKNENKDTSEVKFKNFAYEFLQAHEGQVRDLTLKGYTQDLQKRILPEFGEKRLSQIKPMELKRWQNELKKELSAKRINNIRSVFELILKSAVSNELIDKNPFNSVAKLQNKKTEINPLSLDEVALVLKTANKDFANVLKVAFFTGMRTGELIALRWENIDFKKETIRIDKSIRQGQIQPPKTQNSIRTIPMLPCVKEALLALKQGNNSEWVFAGLNGSHLYEPKSLSKKWANTLKKAGLAHRVFYQTRHTFASIMISKGEDVLWVSQTMGHSDAVITFKRYAKSVENTKQRANFLQHINL
ncbi:Putative defective protein IntQ [Campylobacter majalis]|uniref:Defective protein IntQ n=1 Tax=Campylobacter majalis TaxID=2790656 RepID=A0ABM8Q4H1_9BACT|nr:site-specific integrase [Campylobacter majalis]CAD7287775.1 Putative defective protein IntQ [Campylobacter majalis]